MHKWLGGLTAAALLAGAPVAGASTVYTQTPQSPYAGSGSSPTAAFLQGDFDGDGRPDVFVGDSDGTYRVFLGLGDGTFQPTPASAPFPTTGIRQSFVSTVGRFNGDALDDVALTHLNSAGVTILLATGGGAFRVGPGSPYGADNGRAVAAGRVNGDAFTDLAVVTQTGNFTVLLGDGTGRFTPGFGPLALGSAPLLALGPIGAGPSEDVALGVSALTAGVGVLLNDGAGGFAPAPGSPFPTGTRSASRPHVADMNHDGLGDVAMSHSSSADNVVSVLLGTPSGTLASAPGSPFAAGVIGPSSTSDPALMGGDEHLDVVATGTQSDQITVLQGDGAGRLAPMQGTPFPSGATSPQASVISDYNGDGVNDIAYVVSNVERSIYVLLGRRAAVGDREVRFPATEPGRASGTETFHVTNTAAFPISFGGAAIAGPNAGDFLRGDDGCSGRTIAAGGGCDIGIRFLPSAAGARSATLTLAQDGDVLSAALSGTGTGAAGVLAPVAPSLTAFSVANATFAVARGGRASAARRRGRAPKRGTTFRATVSRAATLQIAIDRIQPGRRAGGSCRRPTRANRRARSCTRFVRRGTLTYAVRGGANALPWNGRFGRRAAAAGRYRATAIAVADGLTSNARTATFRIVRG
jgi:hypothetical protein